MDWKNFIKPELLILIPVLYAFGVALRHSAVKNRLIPLFLGIAGIVLAALYVGTTTNWSGVHGVFQWLFSSITQGVLCAGASVYVNQIAKQSNKTE